jgi:hypothetical protein
MIRIILSCFLSFFVLSTLAQEITGMFNFGGAYQDTFRGYTSDEEGNTYITAQNTGMLYYGNLSFPSVVGAEPYSYIMKIDPQGNYLWHQTMNFSNTDILRGQSIIVDSDQNIYLTMLYNENAEIQGYELTPFIGISGYFTAKFNSLGEIMWLHPAGGKSIAFADENTLCVFEYRSPDGMIGNETITNYEGCVYKMDLDGNYQDHVQIDLPEYTSEIIIGLNNTGEFYGYRMVRQ